MEASNYLAFGLHIESGIRLPVPTASAELCNPYPTVSINKARPDTDWAGLLSDADGGDCFIAALKAGGLRYAVLEGKQIVFLPSEDVPGPMASFMMETMATGFAFSILLRQRGFLALHASVLRKGSNTIGFVGDSGYGKSTLAEFFSQQGYDVLTDDIGALRVSDKEIRVVAGYPLVKLHRPSAHSLLRAEESTQKMMDGRAFVTKSLTNYDPVPLDRLYLLEKSFSPATELSTINPQSLIFQLVQHTHGSKHLVRDDYQSRLLQQCTTVAKHVPIRVLHRKAGLEHLPAVLEVVEDDLSMSQSVSAQCGTTSTKS